MKIGKCRGLIKEARNHTPMQGTAATVEPVRKLFPMIVMESLHQGKENAVSAEALCSYLGVETVRELQKERAKERAAGTVILSTCQNGGGYFRPGNRWKVVEFIKTLESRGRHTLMAFKSARVWLGQWEDTEA